MNFLTVLGIILIVVGVVGLIYGGITYTSHEDVVDLGFMKMEVEQKKRIPATPIASAVALAAGVGLVVYGRRRNTGSNVL